MLCVTCWLCTAKELLESTSAEREVWQSRLQSDRDALARDSTALAQRVAALQQAEVLLKGEQQALADKSEQLQRQWTEVTACASRVRQFSAQANRLARDAQDEKQQVLLRTTTNAHSVRRLSVAAL
jgi:hypothetical protein